MKLPLPLFSVLIAISPCGVLAKDPSLLSLGMEHFKDTATVADDPAKGLTTISTERGFVEHSGLMAMVWHDEFLTALIDTATGRKSFQIDLSITYNGARRSYLTADLGRMAGPAAVVPTLVNTESANCATGECIYTDHLMIPVDEALLRRLAAAYVPGKPSALTYTVTARRAAAYRGELSNAEIAGLLAKVDAYEASPTTPSMAGKTPRRLQFGISGIAVTAAAEMPDRAGVLVVAVNGGSVAQRAGIITGDIIFGIDDRPIRSLGDLEADVAAIAPASPATVEIYRGLGKATLNARF